MLGLVERLQELAQLLCGAIQELVALPGRRLWGLINCRQTVREFPVAFRAVMVVDVALGRWWFLFVWLFFVLSRQNRRILDRASSGGVDGATVVVECCGGMGRSAFCTWPFDGVSLQIIPLRPLLLPGAHLQKV